MTTVEQNTGVPHQPGEPRHRAESSAGASRATGGRPRVRGRVFRPRRMVPAMIVAAVLVVVSALAAAGIIAVLAGRRLDILHADAIGRWLAGLSWSDPVAKVVGAVVVLVGLLLVVIAIVPGRPRVVALNCAEPDVVAGITRRGLRCVAAVAASDVDGVDRVRTKARGRRVRVKVTTPLRDSADAGAVAGRTRQAVEKALDDLDLARPVRVAVRLRRSG
jgi:hypothetical protein